jgi:hypothetical protein
MQEMSKQISNGMSINFINEEINYLSIFETKK